MCGSKKLPQSKMMERFVRPARPRKQLLAMAWKDESRPPKVWIAFARPKVLDGIHRVSSDLVSGGGP